MEADEKFLKLFHNNLVGMICTDEDHRVTDINDHLLDLIGLERHEALGKTGIELNLLNPARIQAMWQEMATPGGSNLRCLLLLRRANKDAASINREDTHQRQAFLAQHDSRHQH